MSEPKPSSQLVLKVSGGLFAALIAPTITGVVVWYIQKKLDDPPPGAAANPPAQVAAGPIAKVPYSPKDPAKDIAKDVPKPTETPAVKTPTVLVDASKKQTKDAPRTPPATVSALASTSAPSVNPSLAKKKKAQTARLFNGRDLTGFDTYLGTLGPKKLPYGRNKDPENVFTVRAGELHISGKIYGGLMTLRDYENYHLTVDYKWGQKKWPPREDAPRMTGIVLHASGPPGAIHGWSMAGIVCLISERDTGALAIPDDPPKTIRLSAEAERLDFRKTGRSMFVYKPGEPLTKMESGALHRLGFRPPALQAKPAFAKQVSPHGEWNTLECVCAGSRITVILNGKTVNVATRGSESRGKIFIESHGAEIIFRAIEMRPLSAAELIADRRETARP